MAKKSAKSNRQAVIDDLRRKQKGADRRRGFAIVAVCVVVALAVLAYPVWSIVADNREKSKYSDTALADIGAPASVCQDIITKPAQGSNEHRPSGEQVTYTQSPPAFGPHWNEANLAPDPMGRKFYTAEDRPELESLIHNSEHGYNIIWYDETAAKDKDTVAQIRAIADKFSGTTNLRNKFKAVPWTAEDEAEHEGEWPEDTHVAFTHWSAGGAGETDATKQVGVWQYCSDISGEAFDSFVQEYPYLDSPEPNAM